MNTEDKIQDKKEAQKIKDNLLKQITELCKQAERELENLHRGLKHE